jgi:SagB-type dehydrogenase family enzyme
MNSIAHTTQPTSDRHVILARTRMISLPTIQTVAGPSVQSAMGRRRSIRAFSPRELTWLEIGQLLWAAQGVSDPEAGLRTAPSAGALYPLEIDVVTAYGVFRYQPEGHTLAPRSPDDMRSAVSRAALGQAWLADAPCLLSFAAVIGRTARKYQSRAWRYVHLEVGHAAQNSLLMAAALGLGATPVGAFDDVAMTRALGLDRTADPVYLVAVGWPPD